MRLVTPILTYDDIESLQEIIRLLRKAGAKSSPSRGCGVHIHIGKGDHTAKTIRNLVNIMAAHEQQIGRAIRIDAGRTGHYCQVVNHRFLDRLNREKPTTMRKLEDIWYEGNGSSWETGMPTTIQAGTICFMRRKSYAENLLEQTLLRDCSPEISA